MSGPRFEGRVSATAPWPQGLRVLAARIDSGAREAAEASWPRSAEDRGTASGSFWEENTGTWRRLSSGGGPPRERVSELIHQAADRFARDRGLLLDNLVRPREWMLLACEGSRGRQREPIWVYRWWCWGAEALWEACERAARADAPGPLVEVHLARPLAARLRFLMLSEAFRHRGEGTGPWFPSSQQAVGGPAAFGTVFGSGSWPVFAERARQARWTWRDHLDSHQSVAVLAQAGPGAVEHEIDQLLFVDGRRPLSLRADRPDLLAPPTADDRAVLLDGVTNHLLPTFRLAPVARAALWPQGSGRPRRWTPPVLAAGALLAVLLAVVLAVLGRFRAACWCAAAGYGLVGTGALAVGPTFLLPWLMRWPAAAGLGMLALSGLNGDWWRGDRPPGSAPGGVGVPHAAVLLLVVAYGYLTLQARNHGVAGWASVRRAGGVLAVGVVHALLVALLALVVVLPAFCEGGTDLVSIFTGGRQGRARTCLLSATAWGLAAGVLTQVLWDERPITAPLAHTGWRSRRDP